MPELQHRGNADQPFPTAVRIGGAAREKPILPRPPAWTEQAACLGMDVNLFFPSERGPVSAEAQETCGGCPVRNECLGFALERDEEHGVFGGMGPRDRHELSARSPGSHRPHHRPAGSPGQRRSAA